ncbi:hypothetical protein AGLY_001613 [Aphis glycines]|uniref:Uncharacterized protein n=1 Tax=Aphis glycines TaxID=307491 RepID=A0A6G0U5T4_APHGL|nr:hypothetical protein AGLY_001613 [Aphis glycines]
MIDRILFNYITIYSYIKQSIFFRRQRKRRKYVIVGGNGMACSVRNRKSYKILNIIIMRKRVSVMYIQHNMCILNFNIKQTTQTFSTIKNLTLQKNAILILSITITCEHFEEICSNIDYMIKSSHFFLPTFWFFNITSIVMISEYQIRVTFTGSGYSFSFSSRFQAPTLAHRSNIVETR